MPELNAHLRPAQAVLAAAGPASRTGGANPAGTEGLATLPGALPVDASVLQALRKQASQQVAAAGGERLGREDTEQLARSVVTRVVADWASVRARTDPALTREQETAVRTAFFDAMFRAGPVQALLDDPAVEDVLLDGTRVVVDYFDQPRTHSTGLFGSDDALVAWVNEMARDSGHGERQLSQASPQVGFRLRDGCRVQASLLSTRPTVAIRRHRLQHTTLEDLQAWGTLSPALTQFLRACVEARRNVLIAGDMGAGKTSMLRSLGRVIPAQERVVTLESERELFLDSLPTGPYVVAFEARQGNGERDAVGAVTIADMFAPALRYNAHRVIVGEVRSTEVVPMLQAMSAGGSGSMCTIHARRPDAVLGRLIQLCTQAGMSEASAGHLVAHSVDLIVYIRQINETALGGRRHRFVSHVIEVHQAMEAGRPTTSALWAPAEDEPRATYVHPPSFLPDLVREGRFDRGWLQEPHSRWPRTLELVKEAAA